MVLLPFSRDEGGVKIGFKAIRRECPNFQNELVHINLDINAEELRNDSQKILELLSSLKIEETTGNLSLPESSSGRIALFSMLVASEEPALYSKEREVLAVYEKPTGLRSLETGAVSVQRMRNAKNKVTIPIKKQLRNTSVDELKENLQK